MRIDLHVHCSEYSGCAISPAAAVIEAAVRRGLDALVFTNHRTFVPTAAVAAWNEEYAPFRVFNGIELTVEGEDFLVFGVIDFGMEWQEWSYTALRGFVSERGGCLAWAHPYRYRKTTREEMWAMPPDAVERRSNNIRAENYPAIDAAMERMEVPAIATSDAHHAEVVGAWYVELNEPVVDEAALAAAIRGGAFSCQWQRAADALDR